MAHLVDGRWPVGVFLGPLGVSLWLPGQPPGVGAVGYAVIRLD